jgi:hypothetical protein
MTVGRTYKRIWIWRKRRGIPTRKPFLDEQFSPGKLKRRKNIIKQAAYTRKKLYVDSKIGHRCFICGMPAANIHNKSGSKHDFFYKMPWSELEKILEKEKKLYSPLCKACHKDVHYTMEKYGVGWRGALHRLKR